MYVVEIIIYICLYISIASTLARKFKRAQIGKSESEKAYTDLTSKFDSKTIKSWKRAEEKALKDKLKNIEAMDIFDVKLELGI